MSDTDTDFDWFVGIDWGNTAHDINVGNASGSQVRETVVKHTVAAVNEFLTWLTKLAGDRLDRVAVAIEMPRGAIVDTLLERGAAVFTLNPKQVDRFRDRFSVAGAKDNRFDALVLRSAVRTDRGCFRRLAAEGPQLIQLRGLARADEDLAEEFSRLTNRLREEVYRVAPEWLTLSTDAGDPWFWALLEQQPPFGRRRSMSRRAVEQLLRHHRIRRVSPEEVLTVVAGPRLSVAPGTVTAVVRHVALLLPRLKLVHTQRQQCARELEALIAELSDTPSEPSASGGSSSAEGTAAHAVAPSDVAIMRSTPGIGRFVITSLLCDASHVLGARDYQAIRTLSGAAPVRRQTGRDKKGRNKKGTVSMRYACNQRLREALYHWARISTQVDATAKAYYAKLRMRGHTHGRALRSVADRWLRILIAMLKTKTVYDPARFTVVATHPLPVTAG